MRWKLLAYRSDTGRGGWIAIYHVRPFDRGCGRAAFSFLIGADSDLPWRPWPQLWIERRPAGATLISITMAGVGIAITTSSPRTTRSNS